MNKIHNHSAQPLISLDMTLFELIEAYPSLLSILARLDITLPFGDITLSDMCKRDNHSSAVFLTLCSMHIDPSFRPANEELTVDMIDEVVGYLRASHRYYSSHMLPHASKHLDDILAHCDDLSRTALRRFYTDYVRYVENHFEEEERTIFRLIESSVGTINRNLDIFDSPHSDIDDRTNDIASLVFKSLPEKAPTVLRTAMLKDIYALRDDLRRHSNIESYLLKPLVDKFINTKR